MGFNKYWIMKKELFIINPLEVKPSLKEYINPYLNTFSRKQTFIFIAPIILSAALDYYPFLLALLICLKRDSVPVACVQLRYILEDVQTVQVLLSFVHSVLFALKLLLCKLGHTTSRSHVNQVQTSTGMCNVHGIQEFHNVLYPSTMAA